MSPARQRASHRRVAQALERLHRADPGPVSARIASHYERGGEGEKAAPHYLRAGEVAQRVYANEEAIGHYQRVLALLDRSPDQQAERWRFDALGGLGQLYLRVGELDRAGRSLEEAISLGQRVGLPPRQVVHALWWLGRVHYEQVRYREMIPIAEQGLALLGDDAESFEAALMNETLASGHLHTGNHQANIDYNYRNAGFVERLPYSGSLGLVYRRIIDAYCRDKRADGASKWVRRLEQEASARGDADALGNAHSYAGRILTDIGDLHGAVSRLTAGVEIARRTGDVGRQSARSWYLGFTHLRLGDLDQAEELAHAVLDIARTRRMRRHTGWGHILLAQVLLCRRLAHKARDLLQESLTLLHQLGLHEETLLHESLLGRVHLALEEQEKARHHFASSLDRIWSARSETWYQWGHLAYPLILADVLSGLERAYLDPEAFRDHCRALQQRFSGGSLSKLWRQPPFYHWFLELAEVERYAHAIYGDGGRADLAGLDWAWHDPFGDCSFTVEGSLDICAANGRALWFSNVSAPRLLLPVPGGEGGALAVEAGCEPVSEEKPAIGGLLLWVDQENYLRLDRGSRGPDEITFLGCVDNEDQFIGRGCLPADSREDVCDCYATPVFLRLERSGGRVRALCSADGRTWFSAGQTSFPTAEPLQVGVYAIGNIDRAVYLGAYPKGTTIRFRSFQLWER